MLRSISHPPGARRIATPFSTNLAKKGNWIMFDMIKVIELVKAIDDLELTGSYRFKTATSESDIDFFCLMNGDNIAILHRLGFKAVNRDIYNDCLCKAVFKHEAANIHVQLVANMTTKRNIQNFLLQCPISLFKEKNCNTAIWNWATSVLGD